MLSSLLNFWLLTSSTLAVADSATENEIYLKSLNSNNNELIKFGKLLYDLADNKANFIPESTIKVLNEDEKVFEIPGISYGEEACVGTKDEAGDFSCFSYKKLSNPLKGSFIINLKSNNEILSLDFLTITNEKSEELIPVEVNKPTIGSRPTLKTTEVKVKKTKEQLEKEKLENQTFFQKYWMYIAPIAIIMLMGGKGEPAK